MSCLIYVKNEQQLRFIRQKMLHASAQNIMYLTTDPQVWHELASDSREVLWAGDFVGGDDWKLIEDQALCLRDNWCLDIGEMLLYEGINLAELIRLEHTRFFRQIVRSQTILERIFQEYAVRQVIVIGRCEKPCWAGDRGNNKSGLFEGVLLWEAYKRGLGIESIAFEVPASEIESTKEENQAEAGQRVFGFNCWNSENASKLIAVGSPLHLIIMEPFVRAWSKQTGCEGLLLNLGTSIKQSNKRAGFQLPLNTRFVSVVDFSNYKQNVEYVQTQKRIMQAFEQWNKSRQQSLDNDILKNPHLNFHWSFLWNNLIQLPASVQKAFEALRVMDPDVLLTCEMAFSNVRVFTEAAKKKGILAVDSSHGYVGDIEEFEPHGDMYLAWGQETAKQLRQRFKKDNPPIVVTGSPVNERVVRSQPSEEKQQLYEKTGLNPNKKTICVVTQGVYGHIWPVNMKEVVAGCEQIASLAQKPDIQIIIKVSPRVDHVGLYKRIFDEHKNVFVCTEYTLDELFPIIDVGVMFFYVGTASLLFMHKNIPTIFMLNRNIVISTDIPWQVFDDTEPLTQLCNTFLYDSEARSRRLMLQKQFARQHLHIDQGSAAQRAALTMKNAITDSRKPAKPTRQRRDVPMPPPQTEPGKIGCLAICAPQIGKISETFITRQINNIAPDRTVLVTGVINPKAKINHPCLVIPYSTGPSVYHAEVEERVVRFFQEHRVTHILCQYGCYGADMIELNQRRLHLPIVVHFHGGDASLMLRNPWMTKYYKWMGARVTGIIAVSRKMANRLVEIGMPEEKIRIVPCGVEIPSAIYANPQIQPCRFVSVIRMFPKKAPLLLLRAFSKVRDSIADCTLDIIGEGPLFDEAKQFVDANGLNNSVTLHGARSNEYVMKYLHNSSVYVQHSIVVPETGDSEGLPVAILEASAAGLPVVSTLHEGIPDEVQHGVTGFLVKEGDVDAMADYMIKLAQAPEMRRKMGLAAYEKIAAEFAMPACIQKLRDRLTLSDIEPRPMQQDEITPPQALTTNEKEKTSLTVGNKDATLAALEKAVKDNPNSVESHNNLGLFCHKTGDIRRAMQSFLNALRLDKTDNNTITNICRLYKQMGWTKEAESLMRQCSQENSRNLSFLNETKSSNITSEPDRKSDLKFSFIMIVLNGMPFIEYSLRAIYDFAHEIIIAEGAVADCMFAAKPDGSSRDGTVEFIKSFPDPQNKIKLIQAKWPEKCEMQNEALKHVTGDYVWLIDSDEVYKRSDLEKINQLLRKDPSITQVNFIPDNFWKGLDYIFVSPMFFEHPHHYRRLFKYVPGAQFITHRPPTMVWPDSSVTTEQMHLLDGSQTRQMGIVLYHYSYVEPGQVAQKMEYYDRRGPKEVFGLSRSEWYHQCYNKWTPENRKQIEANYPVWMGDKNTRTEIFKGTHPEVMADFVASSGTTRGRAHPPRSSTQKKKKALVSYITAPLRMGSNYHPFKFSNPGIARSIVKVLTQMDYLVDVIEYNCKDFKTDKVYDLFIGHGGVNWEYLSRNVVADAIKIYFSTGTYWKQHNQSEAERFNNFERRHGVRLPFDRWIKKGEEFACHDADGIICLGNKNAAQSYAAFPLCCNLNNGVYHDNRCTPTAKDFASGANHFLYFGSAGNIHKGLDLLIEAFMQLDAHLWCAGKIEPAFHRVYADKLGGYPNIHFVNPDKMVPLRSPLFYDLMDRCNYAILPSCAEGSPGGVIECMNQGLMPIVSRAANIDVGDYGIMLETDSIDEIIRVVRRVTAKPEQWHRERSMKTKQAVLRDFSEEAFCRNLQIAIENVIRQAPQVRSKRAGIASQVQTNPVAYLDTYANDLGAILRGAQYLILNSKFDEAARLLERLLHVDPTCVTALCELAAYYSNNKQINKALKHIAAALELSPKDSRSLLVSEQISKNLSYKPSIRTTDTEFGILNANSCPDNDESSDTVNRSAKIAADYVPHGAKIDTESSFAKSIEKFFERIHPKRIIETGTYLGTGTTTVIARALKKLALDDAVFYTIEVNPQHYLRARQHLVENDFNVRCLNGLSVPRSMLPSREDIRQRTVTNIECEGIFVDHKETERVTLYYKETDFTDVPDNLLYKCLEQFDFRPEFVLLDSAGHMGNVEFNYLVANLRGSCYIGLDDIYHVKHHKSYEQIKNDSRFELVMSSREKFGFCIAKYTPQKAIIKSVNISKDQSPRTTASTAMLR
ncbi:MAG: glycosyltransferase [Planctomycetota bacterium]|jgi:glycosyltransferase involved in cell wall biosynthesis/Tfp pilus assembly protein PilF